MQLIHYPTHNRSVLRIETPDDQTTIGLKYTINDARLGLCTASTSSAHDLSIELSYLPTLSEVILAGAQKLNLVPEVIVSSPQHMCDM